ncbi:MAG: sulfatase-like hydrolase/transferase [Pirellulaceae bacterium]
MQDAPSLPRMLAANGYRCLQTGKFWEGSFPNAGFTDGMSIASPSGGKYGDLRLPGGDLVAHGNGDHGLAIGRQTMQPINAFLDEVAPNDAPSTPFFIWYAPFLPHVPHDSPQRFVELARSRPGVAPHELPYFASIAQFDETVGLLRAAIERRNLANNTLFVFAVDNGWVPDARRYVRQKEEWDHTKNSKRAPFDAGLRTPILFRLPGSTVAATHQSVVSSIDLVPTILAATGTPMPERPLPGRNLWQVATGQAKADPDRAVFGELYPGDARELGKPEQDIAYRWVRKGGYKLIVPHAHNGRPPWGKFLDRPALFDITSDPEESTDLLSEPSDDVTERTKLRRIQHELQSLLDQWWLP